LIHLSDFHSRFSQYSSPKATLFSAKKDNGVNYNNTLTIPKKH
jgi:hypothetical protein